MKTAFTFLAAQVPLALTTIVVLGTAQLAKFAYGKAVSFIASRKSAKVTTEIPGD